MVQRCATHRARSVICKLDDGVPLQATDSAIVQPAGVGVWPKADVVTWFQEISAAPATFYPEPSTK